MNVLRKTKSFSVSRAPPQDSIVARGRIGKRPERVIEPIAEEATVSDRWSTVGSKQELSSMVNELKKPVLIKPKEVTRNYRVYMHDLPKLFRVGDLLDILTNFGPILNGISS
jgi:hypothetical protein